MLALLLAAAELAGPPKAYVWPKAYIWNEYIPGRTIAYGIPDTGQRAVRIDCEQREGQLHLFLGGPAGGTVGHVMALEITSRAGTKIFRSWIVDAADGPNFSFEIAGSEDLIATLMAGGDVRISTQGTVRTIPGEGAAAVLGPLLKACPGA
jgi:hypothetical protein